MLVTVALLFCLVPPMMVPVGARVVRSSAPAPPQDHGRNGLKLMTTFRQLTVSTFLLGLASLGCASQSAVMVSGLQPAAQRVVKSQRSFMWGLIESDQLWDPRAQ